MGPAGGVAAPSSDGLRVSVVIANHNYEHFVAAAIDSALAQTHPDVEVIVVDDGSTDDSVGVIAGFGDRVRLVGKANGGQASAYNAGAALATGGVLCFLDADDVLLPDAASRAVAAFATDHGLVRLQFRMPVVDADLRPLGRTVPPAHVRMPRGDLRHRVAHAPESWWSPSSGNFFRVSTLRRLLPLDETEAMADNFLVRATALLGRIESLDGGALYRVHGRNHSQEGGLDLGRLRGDIGRAAHNTTALAQLAASTGVPYPGQPRDLRDTVFLMKRLVSLVLAPGEHPIDDHGRWRLAWWGVVAGLRRRDVPWRRRLQQAAWFAGFPLLPRRMAREAAVRALFPAAVGASVAASPLPPFAPDAGTEAGQAVGRSVSAP